MPHICPWWGGYFIDNPLRRLLHDPQQIVGPYVQPGATVMDVGCGMGLFSIAMAQMVGARGRVIAVDLQQQMLDVLRRRAERADVADRIHFHRCQPDRLGMDARAAFVLAFAVLHEVPDQRRLLAEIRGCLKSDGKVLIAEPRFHVSAKAFAHTVATAEQVGLKTIRQPPVRWCRAAVFQRR